MIGHGIVPIPRQRHHEDAVERQLATGARSLVSRATGCVGALARRVAVGTLSAAESAVEGVRNNRYRSQDILVGLGAVLLVSSDRVGYIRDHIRQREALQARAAVQDADDAEEVAIRLAAAAAAVMALRVAEEQARNAAQVLGNYFVRRRFFWNAAIQNRVVGAGSPNRITIERMVETLEYPVASAAPRVGPRSDLLVQAVRENEPRLVYTCAPRPWWWRSKTPLPEPAQPPPGAAAAQAPSPSLKGPQPTSAFKRGPLFSSRCEWKDRMEDEERAAEGIAQFLSVGTNGEPDVTFMSGQSFWTRLLNRYYIRHKSYHRASNKFCKRLRTLRVLREDMIFTGVGHKRERTNLNLAAAEELAKKIVTKAVDDGVIDSRDARWFKSGLVETYFVRDDDDTFWAGLAAAPQAVRA